jgi:hypothetical protein
LGLGAGGPRAGRSPTTRSRRDQGARNLSVLRRAGIDSGRLVDVRGLDYNYDGDYYVKSVTHRIRKGEDKQRFTLAREGAGSCTQEVIP